MLKSTPMSFSIFCIAAAVLFTNWLSPKLTYRKASFLPSFSRMPSLPTAQPASSSNCLAFSWSYCTTGLKLSSYPC